MKLETGVQIEPNKDLIYGVEGVGKSSLAATYPDAIFIDCEGSTTKLNVARLRVKNWNDFKSAFAFLISSDESALKCKTVVIDTVDWLEKHVVEAILIEDHETSMAAQNYAYGKGDVRIEGFFDTKIIPMFEKLTSIGKNVVLTAHSTVKPFNDPINGPYDYYAMDMTKKAAATLREWTHNVFFLNYKTNVKITKGIGKNTATGGKEVIVYTQRTPQYEAKRRDPLADEIKFNECVCPYPQIIGTTLMAKEKDALISELLPEALATLKETKTEEDVTKHWSKYSKLRKVEEYKNAVIKKGASFKKNETDKKTDAK